MTAVSDFQKYCYGVLLVLMYSNTLACVPEKISDECRSYSCYRSKEENQTKNAEVFKEKIKANRFSSAAFKNNFARKFCLGKSDSQVSDFRWQSLYQNFIAKYSQKLISDEFADFHISEQKNRPKNKDDLEERFV
ncbi:hypothetical protein ASG01_04395 [Chryseobacterium sp. Leaf180]|uniref:hypothetical protein n=1 Tax=Chryseobacterium sp. Leaf180 TaxID=1736289 RepID=UPI0006FDEB19|nr:hypothetical protein [Chryseobacterium sp. Leaf180]KQR95103.1 hypothetical protein ASG01_04395 [Chryseobacterium sp. Leaf180]